MPGNLLHEIIVHGNGMFFKQRELWSIWSWAHPEFSWTWR